MTSERFHALFGGPPRLPESPITRREMDIAASVQLVAEDVVLRLAAHAVKIAGHNTLVMAGGVALNCVANGRLIRESGLDGLFVQPAAGDAGGALGAALLTTHQHLGVTRMVTPTRDAMKGSCLGPSYSTDEIEDFLDRLDIPNEHMPDPEERARSVAQALASGLVVGFFTGRMEFGPRALGARSILGDPRRGDMQSRMNLKIKFRESFRPFAPSILVEYAKDYFALDVESPYMLVTAPVQSKHRLPQRHLPGDDDDVLSALNRTRSDIPAVTHVDYSARVQTVGAEANPEFRRLLQAFHTLTGCPLLVNTSFNVRGEPIVCSPQDAYSCFMNTGMDLLVLEDRLLWKEQQVAPPETHTRAPVYDTD